MKIGIVYRLDRPGGIQSCAFSLIKGLNAKGMIPDILWDVEPDWALFSRLGIEARNRYIHFTVPSSTIDKLPYSGRYLAGIANAFDGDQLAHEYDFLYIFYNGFLLSNGASHLRYMPGVTIVPQLDTTSPGIRGVPMKVFGWTYEHFFKQTRPVYEFHPGGNYVTISRYTAGLFKAAFGVDLPVIYPPVDLSRWSFDFGDLGIRDTITFFSRFADYKRPEMVLDLARRYPHLRCVLMGGVPDHRQPYFDSVKSLAKSMGLDKVIFMANPTPHKVKEELARTRFYIFPTINEHFGMTTTEAIASGAIPFVHNSGGQKEIVCDPDLRFEDSEYHQKFAALMGLSAADLNQRRKTLLAHLQMFSEDAFNQRMLSFLEL